MKPLLGTDVETGKASRVKDPRQEVRSFTNRSLLALSAVLAAFLALVVKLAYLQIVHHERYASLSENNRVKLQPLLPTRGLIYDRNGVLLADNLPSYRLELTPEDVPNLGATLNQLRERIALSDADINRFRRLAGRSPAYNSIPLRFGLNDEEVARLALDLHRFPGVAIQADLTRYYPLGAHAAHVIGYVGRIDEDELQRIDARQYRGRSHIGKTGVERSYEDLVRGDIGYQHLETNAEGRMLRVLEKTFPAPGKNVYLSIDSRLQATAEQALEGHTGAIVAIDPRNGEILAMASMPSYDPNPFVNGIDNASFQVLNTSPARPLFNRALRGVYPPGSTIKPFVGLAGLETGATTRGKYTFCPGAFRVPGQSHRFRCWRRGGHGSVNMDGAIAQSCDVYFYNLALDMGMDRLRDYLLQFNLGRRTSVDMIGEKPGLVPSPEWKMNTYNRPWYSGETVIAGIGQGYMLTTPLQLAHAVATLAKGGKGFQPRILHATQDQGTRDIIPVAPRPLPSIPVKNAANWELIVTSMTHVVSRGTARKIGVGARYAIAGKTGTSQVFSLRGGDYNARRLARHLQDHALFIAFAPAEDPRIAVAVLVEHGGGGSATAAPLARRVLDAYLLPSS